MHPPCATNCRGDNLLTTKNNFRHIRYIAFAAVVLTALGAGARDAAQWLVSAPANVLSGVPRNTRLDALDYYNSGVSRDVAAADSKRKLAVYNLPMILIFEPIRSAGNFKLTFNTLAIHSHAHRCNP